MLNSMEPLDFAGAEDSTVANPKHGNNICFAIVLLARHHKTYSYATLLSAHSSKSKL